MVKRDHHRAFTIKRQKAVHKIKLRITSYKKLYEQ